MNSKPDLLTRPIGTMRIPSAPRQFLAELPIPTVLSLLTVIVAWEIVGRLGGFRALPPLTVVWEKWLEFAADGLWAALATSAGTFATGYLSAVVLAAATAVVMTASKSIGYLFRPVIDAGMSIPITAVIPVLMMIFGLGNETRIVVVFLFCYFTMVVSMQAGLEKVNPALREMAQAFAATPVQTFWRIVVPTALPLAVTGMRLGVSRAIHGLVNSEVIIATAGIGWLLIRSSREFDIPGVYAVTGTIVVATIAIMGLATLLERRAFGGRS